jgi:tetratricopeptide (TPR) repeat protein
MRKKASSRPSSFTADVSAGSAATAPQDTQTPESQSLQPSIGDRFTTWRNLYVLIPAALALLVSINTLWNDFASDDLQQVLNNESIKKFSHLPYAFTTSVWAFLTSDIAATADWNFRPLYTALFTTNYAIFGTSAWGWHLVNVLIHMGATMMVFLVINEVIARKWTALIAASLFAVHPVHAEPVAWVSAVIDPLMALFALAAFYFYLRYRKRGDWYYALIAAVLFFGALLTKETALGLLLVIAYCELSYFKDSPSLKPRAVHPAMLAGLFALPTLIYFLMRHHAVGSVLSGGPPRNPLGASLATIPIVILKYLGLTVFPYGYNYQHDTALVERITSLSFIVPLFALIALAVAVVWARSRALTFAAVWFVATLAVALVVLRQFEPAYLVQERSLYLPSVGVCLAAALGIEWLAARQTLVTHHDKAVASITAVLVIALGAVCFMQNRVWSDSLTLYRRGVAVNPDSSVAHVVLSRSYFDAGRPRDAEAEGRKALDLGPNNLTAYMNMSFYARASGKSDTAIGYLEQAVATIGESPMTRYDLATAYLNLALLYVQQKDFDRTETFLLKSIKLSPRPVAWYYAGQFYYDQNRPDESLKMYQMTAAEVPQWFSPIYIKLGLVYEKLEQKEQAIAEYEKFLSTAPPESPDIKDVQSHLSQLRGNPKKAKP